MKIFSQSYFETRLSKDLIKSENVIDVNFFLKLQNEYSKVEKNYTALDQYIVNERFKTDYEKILSYLYLAITSESLGKNIKEYTAIKKAYDLLTSTDSPILKLAVINHYVKILKKFQVNSGIVNELYKEANMVSQKIPKDNYYLTLRFYLINELGKIHLIKKEYSLAIDCFTKARDVIKDSNDKLGVSSGNNNIGYGYYKKKDYDSALVYFERALTFLDTSKKSHVEFKANIYENFGHIYRDIGKTKKALEYYEKSSEYLWDLNIETKAVRADIRAVMLYEDSLGIMPESVTKKVSLVRAYLNENNEKLVTSLDLNSDLIEDFYRFLIKRAKFSKLTNQGEYIYDIWHDYDSYIKKKTNRTEITGSLTEDYLKIMNKHYQQLIKIEKIEKIEKQNKIQKLISSIVILILLVIIMIVVYTNRSLKLSRVKERNKIIELEKKIVEKSLVHKNKDITNLSSQLSIIIDFKKRVLKEIAKFDNKSPEIKKMLNDLKFESTIENKFEVLKTDLDTLNNQFIVALFKLHPELSKAEKEICSMIRLNLSNKEIAVIRNTTINAVKMHRHRIRKKLKLNTDDSLESYISRID